LLEVLKLAEEIRERCEAVPAGVETAEEAEAAETPSADEAAGVDEGDGFLDPSRPPFEAPPERKVMDDPYAASDDEDDEDEPRQPGDMGF
jgi:hypothetical protein